ncbi:MAG: hypothetical protein H6622_08500 [Halobacteriovoraceae bacterium]|nr:hypothetical protein [Halobacteriovoraceae bacterium]
MKRIIIIFIILFFSRSSLSTPYFFVHHLNPVKSLSKDQIKQIFMGESFTWEDGKEIQVVDYKKEVEEKKTFMKDFLKVSPFYLYKKWIRASLQGNTLPIKLFGSHQEVVDFIETTPDAIGYMYLNEIKSDKIKIVPVKNND